MSFTCYSNPLHSTVYVFERISTNVHVNSMYECKQGTCIFYLNIWLQHYSPNGYKQVSKQQSSGHVSQVDFTTQDQDNNEYWVHNPHHILLIAIHHIRKHSYYIYSTDSPSTVVSGFLYSPVCPLHTAVTHVIKGLEPRSTHEFQWQLACETLQFQYYNHSE